VGAVAHGLRAEGFDASEDGSGRQNIIPIDMRQASRGATMTNNRPDGSSGGAPGTGIGEIGDPSPTIASSHVPAIAFDCKASGQSGFGVGDIASTMRAMGHAGSHTNGGGHQAVAFMQNQVGDVICGDVMHSLGTNSNAKGRNAANVSTGWAVRRLTPRECERLQGFPDDYTLIQVRGKPAADGPRYKALGNSMAVNAMRWLGRRIESVSQIVKSQIAA
jgi:DNA (cytosine-5)-methyltransferase 1